MNHIELSRRLSHFLEILLDHTREGARNMTFVKIETEVEFRRQRVRFEFRFWGISLPPIKIFSQSLVGM